MEKLPSIKIASLLIRVGLAFAFTYAAISSFRDPEVWQGFLPDWLTDSVSPGPLLQIMSVAEIILAIWLLSGKWQRYAGLASALLTTSIVLANPKLLLITFRDIPIITASLALFFLDDPKQVKK